jgi:aminoglycoside phosphotransferase (APT) family kinase protein
MGRQDKAVVTTDALERYLKNHGYPGARVTGIHALGGEETGGKKYGYGRPAAVDFLTEREERRLVFRTMGPDPFGHHRRADRVAEMVLSKDTFDSIPRHVRPIDVGTLDIQGDLITFPDGEPWLLTEFVEGTLYADSLTKVAGDDEASPEQLARARALARYLVEMHSVKTAPDEWRRSLRDVIGSGEGIFGLADSFPKHHPVAPASRVRQLEHDAVKWRWMLKGREHRSSRVHGDFHPFNVLFRAGTDFSVLDCSRGAAGEPADDVTCMAINFIFFALLERGRFTGALRQHWDVFFSTYLEESGDGELLDLVAPFFTWRALVVASPVWYPDADDYVRDLVLRFAERLLEGHHFEPEKIEDLLA